MYETINIHRFNECGRPGGIFHSLELKVHVLSESSYTLFTGSGGHVLGYGNGSTVGDLRGPRALAAASGLKDESDTTTREENELMEIGESERDREAMSNSDSGSDEDDHLQLA